MAFIFPLINNPAQPSLQSESQPLGTEGSGFADSLLGLQEANVPEGMLGNQAETTDLANLADLLNPSFGRDAALPMVAENAVAAMMAQQGAQTKSSEAEALAAAQLASNRSVMDLLADQTATKAERATFASEAARSESALQDMLLAQLSRDALSIGSDEGTQVRDLRALLNTPVDELAPSQLKQLVSSVWGDVKEIQVEDAPDSSHADASQHSLLKLMAQGSDETSNRPLEVATNRPMKAPANAGSQVKAQPETAAQAQNRADLADTFSKAASPSSSEIQTRGEKKSNQTDTAFNLAMGEKPMETSDDFTVAKAKTDGGNLAPKLTPQILPRVENLVAQGGGKMTLQLDPPELGRLTIEVTTRGKHVELAIRSDNDQTRVALEGGMADLQQALQSQDLHLTRAEVHSARESSFASMQFGQGTNHQEQASKEGRQSFEGREQKWSRDLLTEAPVTRNRSAGRLDVRV